MSSSYSKDLENYCLKVLNFTYTQVVISAFADVIFGFSTPVVELERLKLYHPVYDHDYKNRRYV